MEQMFQRHRYVLFSEMKEFSFHSSKSLKSFLKIVWELGRLSGLVLRSVSYFLFESQALYRKVGPNHQSVQVERQFNSHKVWSH